MKAIALGFAAAFVISVATPCPAAEPQPTNGTSNAVQALAFGLAGRPNSEAVDIYKFLHQAMFGPGHAITDPARAGEILQDELAKLTPQGVDESWCETLGGEPFLVRVNLRPFVANGFDTDVLLESFVATANAVQGNPQQMGVALSLVDNWLSMDGKSDLSKGLQALAREMEKKGYPSVHHSAAYVQAYQPAYRVVAASMASNHGWCGSTF